MRNRHHKYLLNKTNLKKRITVSITLILVVLFWFCLPNHLFNVSYSTVIFDKNGELLGAHIANDGQWRFPQTDSVPYKFKTSLLLFEDEYFNYHPGVNPFSLVRATYQNIKSGRIISGGSTITMQVIRLSGDRKRTFYNKLIEVIQALRLEITESKDEILSLYATHAPFGGNVVGLETASWRYFQRPCYQLSWAESATLAILPNSPGLIHTSRNRNQLLKKRNRLLEKLYKKGKIDSINYQLAIEEPLVQHPKPLAQLAPHLLDYCRKNEEEKTYKLTIDKHWQEQLTKVIRLHHIKLSTNEIHNAGAILIDVESGNVLAYIGNTTPIKGQWHENHVDVVTASRSTGSILKPFLYAGAMQDGIILPDMLIEDIPTYFSNFAPKNYNRTYSGAVPASEALSRSLNVPAVRLLNNYQVSRFCELLESSGITTITKSPEYYGLSLILGGAEASLFEISGVYASMARTLNTYTSQNSIYKKTDFHSPFLFQNQSVKVDSSTSFYPYHYSASSIYFTFKALTQVSRPPEEMGWETFSSRRKLAWKTGTSFGYRDAWAIGVTPKYVVGVWVGNATGEGRPGIVGGTTAGPIMFDIFRQLPRSRWFTEPYDDMQKLPVCKQSGFIAGPYCNADSNYIPNQNKSGEICPYHRQVHLSKNGQYRVSSKCYPVSDMKHVNWFVLPPVMEWYYRRNHPTYKKLPPVHPGCGNENVNLMEFIYPQNSAKVFLPKGLDGETQSVVIRVAHRQQQVTLFWHLDDEYIGETNFVHQMPIKPKPGWHKITIIDEQGNMIEKRILCLGNTDE